MDAIAQTLQNYGPWAMVAACFIAIAKMWATINRLNKEAGETAKAAQQAAEERTKEEKEAAEKHRQESMEETKIMVTALVETREALQAFKDAMSALADRMGRREE